MACILFLAGVNLSWHGKPIKQFIKEGADCIVVAPRGFATGKVEGVKNVYLPPHLGLKLGMFFALPALETICRKQKVDHIVPLDDIAAWLLRGAVMNSRVSDRLRSVLINSLGNPALYLQAVSRPNFIVLARRAGVNTPPTVGEQTPSLHA